MWDKFLEFNKRHLSRHFGSTASAATMGLHLVTGPLVGGVGGYFLDEWLGTEPWFFISLLILGIAAGFKNMYVDARLLVRSQEREDAQHKQEQQETLDEKADPPSREG